MLVLGTVAGPRLVQGEGSDIGFPRYDETGALTAGPEAEHIPWLLWVPEAVALDSLPVLVGVGGIGGHKDQVGALSDYMAAGYAVLTYDPFGNGRRSATATDERHDVRGDGAPMTPDGLEEHDATSVVARAFGLEGAATGLTGCPLYTHGLLTQLVADAKTMLRLVSGGDWSSVQTGVPALSELAFDPDRQAVIGISLGSYVASAALVDEPDLEAILLVAAYGSGVDLGTESPTFRPQIELLFGTSLGVRGISGYDEQESHLALHPIVDAYRFLFDGLEAQVNARHLLQEPLHDGAGAHVLWQLGDIDETTGTPSPDALCAATRVPAFGEYPYAEVITGTLPLSGNLEDGRTAACYRFSGAGHGLAHEQRSEREHDPPIVVRQRELEEAIPYENPVVQVNAQALHFVSTAFSGTAELNSPTATTPSTAPWRRTSGWLSRRARGCSTWVRVRAATWARWWPRATTPTGSSPRTPCAASPSSADLPWRGGSLRAACQAPCRRPKAGSPTTASCARRCCSTYRASGSSTRSSASSGCSASTVGRSSRSPPRGWSTRTRARPTVGCSRASRPTS
jgi:dienelactone hydrolase